jgi:hypothetical protein
MDFDPHSLKKLNPDQQKVIGDPKHCPIVIISTYVPYRYVCTCMVRYVIPYDNLHNFHIWNLDENHYNSVVRIISVDCSRVVTKFRDRK